MKKFKCERFVTIYDKNGLVINDEYEELECTEEQVKNYVIYNKLLKHSMTNVVYHEKEITEVHGSYITTQAGGQTYLHKRNYALMEGDSDD